jgi:trk system potassium uptake protein TrkH
MYRKEALAVVGLSWVLATVLGALPYYWSGTALGWTDGPDSSPQPMTFIDCLFESQSGFSTTGATVIAELEVARLVPRCILFWRSTTHFLGGLGIIVLFVAVLGQGSAGKVLMRAEMPGPSKEGSQERMQHTAWNFAGIYVLLNVVLAVLLMIEGMNLFDAICHAFGTMATGGFSTYNASLGYFDSPLIEYTVLLFMVLAGMNFALIYLFLTGRPGAVWADVEWRAYVGTMAGLTLVIMAVALFVSHDFNLDGQQSMLTQLQNSLRYVSFTVVSIMTTTGFGTHDFNSWSEFSKSLLFLLMFVGGCAGSTGGGLKVIRHLLFFKVLALEIEQSYHPSVVRHMKIGGKVIADPDLRKQILFYFGIVTFVFMASWITLVAIEPDSHWTNKGLPVNNKLIDSASAVAATLNNIGPGLGTVGATENYAAFHGPAKLLFVFLMMLGRLEMFAVLVLLMPSFWRDR